MAEDLKRGRITTVLHFKGKLKTKRTVDLIIRNGIEIVDWLSIILKEKKEIKNNDSKRNSEKKRKGGKSQGTTGR
jgi:hypothetical protein